MSLICPACQASYDIDPDILGPKGRKVRCATCGNTWMALPPMPYPPEPQLPPENTVEAKLSIHSDLADFAGPQVRIIQPPPSAKSEFAERLNQADAEIAAHPTHTDFRPIEREAPPKPPSAFMLFIQQYFIPASLVLLAIVLGTFIMARSAIARHAPGMIAVYNMLGLNPLPSGGGLAIMNVRDESRFGQLDNALVIHGDLVNRTDATLKVPLFKMDITSPAGQTKTFMARGPVEKIEPGAIVPFTLERSGFAAQDWDVKLSFGDGSEKDSSAMQQVQTSKPPAPPKEQK